MSILCETAKNEFQFRTRHTAGFFAMMTLRSPEEEASLLTIFFNFCCRLLVLYLLPRRSAYALYPPHRRFVRICALRFGRVPAAGSPLDRSGAVLCRAIPARGSGAAGQGGGPMRGRREVLRREQSGRRSSRSSSFAPDFRGFENLDP